MARVGPSGGVRLDRVPGVRVFGNFDQVYRIAPFLDKVVHDNCERNLQKSAAELESLMKRMIVRNQCGLASNGDLTQELKGGATPLVDRGHLVRAISTAKQTSNVTYRGTTGKVTSCFVGILRTAGIKMPSSHLGKYVPISLYTLAKNQVRGYTVTLPRTGVKKVVPKRDFRDAPLQAHRERHKQLMGNAVAHAHKTLGQAVV